MTEVRHIALCKALREAEMRVAITVKMDYVGYEAANDERRALLSECGEAFPALVYWAERAFEYLSLLEEDSRLHPDTALITNENTINNLRALIAELKQE